MFITPFQIIYKHVNHCEGMEMVEINKETSSCCFVNIKKFALMTGLTEGIVRGWCNRGYVPTKKIGKHLLINVTELAKR